MSGYQQHPQGYATSGAQHSQAIKPGEQFGNPQFNPNSPQFPQNPESYRLLNESMEEYNYIDDEFENSLEYEEDDCDVSRCSEDGALSFSGAFAAGLDQLGTPQGTKNLIHSPMHS